MQTLNDNSHRRILVIDDNPAIHDDFRKILTRNAVSENLQAAKAAFFGDTPEIDLPHGFEVEDAMQGQEGVEKLIEAKEQGRPYAMAFVDMRMPPGWDGLTTIENLWKHDPDLQVVICTAYSDYTWTDIRECLGNNDQWLILKKPFDNAEVCQLASALTEKWTLTQQARLKQHDLQRLVDEQTVQIREQEQSLRQKHKLEAIGSLAGGMAHEFNNLLQVIIGYANFAVEGLQDDNPCRADLNHVLEAADRAGQLTNQMLSFGRKQLAQLTTIDLDELLGELTSLLVPLLGERIKLVVNGCTPGVYVDCDANQLQQALLNLCINARDAMPDGGRLEISLTEMDVVPDAKDVRDDLQPGRFAVISIADSGTGMTVEVRDRIFEPFFTTKDVGCGTGLGLAMVYGFVGQMNGHIDVESEPGMGTTFRILLPATEPAASDSAAEFTEAVRMGNERILVAEDEAAVGTFIKRVLQDAGYEVELSYDGGEAIDKFHQQSGRFDLLLLDVVMPNLNGVEVMQRIRRDGHTIPAIFCTGYATDTPEAATVLSQGMPMIRKPVDPKLLLHAVREALASSVPA